MATQFPPGKPIGRRRRGLWLLTGLLIALFILYSGVSLLAYDDLSLPKRHFTSGTPDGIFSDVSFAARGQNYLVHAFYLPGRHDMPALIDVPGYNMSRHSDYHRRRTNGLRDLGFTVLALDLSDNGGDTFQNGRISMGFSERWDVLGAYDYLLAKGVAPDRIGLVSESMGAATSLLAAGIEPRIRAVWADSPFEDASILLAEQAVARHYPSMIVPGGMVWGLLIAGDRIWEARPIDVAPKLAAHHQAVFLVATRGDHTVAFHHGTDLYAAFQAAGVDTTFWGVPDLDHVQTITVHFDEYMQRLKAFFERHLSSTAPE